MENDNKLSSKTFESLLYLSRLSVSTEEADVFSAQINDLIGYFKILDKFADLKFDDSLYTTHNETKLRSNEIKDGLQQTNLKKMSTEYMDNYFRVPKVLGSGA